MWRKDLKNESLQFFIIQLPDHIYGNHEGRKAIQSVQAEVAESTENTYFIKSTDICEHDHIHPATKLPLAQRIAEKTEKI